MKIDINYIFSLGILAITIFSIVRYFINNNKKKTKEVLDYNEMEKMFFDKISGKNRPYKLLNIYFPFDLMFIKSLLLSEQIPYYVEFEHFMSIRPFVQIINYNNTNLYILEEDYNDAIIVTENYLKTKTLNKYEIKEVFGNLIELALMNWVALSPQNNLGIEIIYKKSGNINETQESYDTEKTIEEDRKDNATAPKRKKKSAKRNFLIFIGLVFIAMAAYTIYNNIPSQPKKDTIETITQYYYYEMFTIPKTEYNAISFPAEWTLDSTNDYRIRLRSSGSKLLNSTATASENDIFTLFTNSGYTPDETDGILSQINSIGNIIFFGEYGEDHDLMHIAYFEKL
jgi:cbb3-type cytochrome oxidase subunit 3